MPLLGDPALVFDDVDEAQRTLWMHVRLTMSMLSQTVAFGIVPQSPPWLFCMLISLGSAAVATKRAVLDQCMCMWELVMKLESSQDPNDIAVLRLASGLVPELAIGAGALVAPSLNHSPSGRCHSSNGAYFASQWSCWR